MAKPTSTTPTVNSGTGSLPAGRDTSGRRVLSEPAPTTTTYAVRDSHRITSSGAVRR